jgi:hypothetical protein
MPMKCIPQMPPPMLSAPALAQAHRAREDDAATMRDEIEIATKAAKTAIRRDSATSHGSYVPWYGATESIVVKTSRKDLGNAHFPSAGSSDQPN